MDLFIVVLIFLRTFSQLTSALPPLRTDLTPELDNNVEVTSPTYHLPKFVVPIAYDLEIRPILDPGYGERFTAPGKVKILIECKENTSSIILHQVNTGIVTATLTDVAENEQIPLNAPYYNSTVQTVMFGLEAPRQLIETKKYELYIEFKAKISQDSFYGLYLSSYLDPATGETRYLAATHLEADYARRLMPLFDEPVFKANWTIHIIRKTHHKSLANQERDGEPVPMPGEPDWVKDNFKELNCMSSYIFAFAVCDYTEETAHASHFGKPVKVWGPPPIMAEGGGKYSSNTSARLLNYYQTTFGIDYALPKMDQISVPDFAIGAMENWGLNTYRESRLLYIDGISTVEDRVRTTSTVSHELSHQWFGNLVTMEWWNDAWLKEGMATYQAAQAVHSIHSNHKAKDALLINSIQIAMQLDATANTNPISPDPEDIVDGSDIANLMGTIIYNKGASVIRMMNAFLTEEIFLNGLKKFLTDHAYGSVVQDDLFSALQSTVANPDTLPPGITVNMIMDTWTKQTGYPVLTVTRMYDNVTINFSQKAINGAETRWWIPITFVKTGYASPADTTTRFWFNAENDNFTLVTPIINEHWLIVNPTQIGNYRVLYDEVNFDMIIDQLNTNPVAIDSLTKSALLDDYFNLAFLKYPTVQLGNALDLTKCLAMERHFVPWITFFTNMAKSYRMLGRSAVFLQYRNYLLSIINPAIMDIKYEVEPTDPEDHILLRTRLVEWACNLGEPNCIKFAKEQFNEWIAMTADPAKNNKINPDLRSTLYCSAMANGGDQEWDFIVARYKDVRNATSSKYLQDTARASLIRALSCAKQSYRLAKLLDNVLDHQTSFLQDQDRLTAIQSVAGNSAGVDLTFGFLRNNFDTLVRRFGVTLVLNTIRTLSNYINSQTARDDVAAFASNKPELNTPSAASSIRVSLGNIDNNILWMNDFEIPLRNWLHNNNY